MLADHDRKSKLGFRISEILNELVVLLNNNQAQSVTDIAFLDCPNLNFHIYRVARELRRHTQNYSVAKITAQSKFIFSFDGIILSQPQTIMKGFRTILLDGHTFHNICSI